MRLEFKTLKKINKELGSFEISGDGKGLSFRFGYWSEIDMDTLQKILPYGWVIDEELVDDDDDCGRLYCYNIRKDVFDYEADLEAQDYDIWGQEKI
tara:strand:- start:2606 stop:2893 length:288 start_codon:yes stop_codon:yes gene_type:complete